MRNKKLRWGNKMRQRPLNELSFALVCCTASEPQILLPFFKFNTINKQTHQKIDPNLSHYPFHSSNTLQIGITFSPKFYHLILIPWRQSPPIKKKSKQNDITRAVVKNVLISKSAVDFILSALIFKIELKFDTWFKSHY